MHFHVLPFNLIVFIYTEMSVICCLLTFCKYKIKLNYAIPASLRMGVLLDSHFTFFIHSFVPVRPPSGFASTHGKRRSSVLAVVCSRSVVGQPLMSKAKMSWTTLFVFFLRGSIEVKYRQRLDNNLCTTIICGWLHPTAAVSPSAPLTTVSCPQPKSSALTGFSSS